MSGSAYESALSGAMVADRPDRGIVRVHGRDPVRMVHGLASNEVQSLGPGRSTYATLLTPKGRMLADLRVIRREADLLLESDAAAIPNILDTFKRFVPPLFAKAETVEDLCVLGVYGPSSRDFLAHTVGAAAAADPAGDDAAAGSAAGRRPAGGASLATVALDDGVAASFRGTPVVLLRTDWAGVDGWDIIVACSERDVLRGALESAGAVAGDLETLEVLRVEAGRARWGAELTGDVIPLEAGLKDRAISTTKGCYTGQEVIIRILHRGHVNRHLRGLLLDRVAASGAELFHPHVRPGKPVGSITSAVDSPRLGAAALGYVRREVDPGSSVHVGAPDGPLAEVVELPFAL